MKRFEPGLETRPSTRTEQQEHLPASAAAAPEQQHESLAAAAAAAAESGSHAAARVIAPPSAPSADRLLGEAERGFFKGGSFVSPNEMLLKVSRLLGRGDLSAKDKVWLTDRLAFTADHRQDYDARSLFMAARLAAEASDSNAFPRQLRAVWDAPSDKLSKSEKTSILRTALRFLATDKSHTNREAISSIESLVGPMQRPLSANDQAAFTRELMSLCTPERGQDFRHLLEEFVGAPTIFAKDKMDVIDDTSLMIRMNADKTQGFAKTLLGGARLASVAGDKGAFEQLLKALLKAPPKQISEQEKTSILRSALNFISDAHPDAKSAIEDILQTPALDEEEIAEMSMNLSLLVYEPKKDVFYKEISDLASNADIPVRDRIEILESVEGVIESLDDASLKWALPILQAYISALEDQGPR